MRKLKNILRLLCLTFMMSIAVTPMETVFADSEPITVILSTPDDAYYALAQEIAIAEGLDLYVTAEEAAAVNPTFLLWVIAPENLSEQVLLNFSLTMKEQSGNISVGILSGQSIEDARSLWERGSQRFIPANDYAIINGNGATQKIKPQIIYGENLDDTRTAELSRENLLAALANQANVQVTVEGTATSWFDQHANITIHGEDIPKLDDSIILHYGCSTFRPWEENSIANACIHQGAAAYIGFIYPSIVGTRFGDYTSNGLLYTWEKFPLGHLVQMQNHASMQSYINASHFYLLGDPRIYRQNEMPYTLIRDEIVGNKRILEVSDLPDGLIPIYVPDGAEYQFVSIPGFSSSAMESHFFNNKVQMMNINQDKFIIVENSDERITIELSKAVPAVWQISNSSIKFFDFVIVDGHNASLYILIVVLYMLLLIIRAFCKRICKLHLFVGMGFGLMMVLIAAVYTMIRMDRIEVTNAPLDFNFLYLAGIFMSVAYGLMLFLDAKSMKGRLIAILATNMNSLVTVLIFMVALLVKTFAFGNTISAEKITYPWLFPLQKLILGGIFYGLVYVFIQRMNKRRGC